MAILLLLVAIYVVIVLIDGLRVLLKGHKCGTHNLVDMLVLCGKKKAAKIYFPFFVPYKIYIDSEFRSPHVSPDIHTHYIYK